MDVNSEKDRVDLNYWGLLVGLHNQVSMQVEVETEDWLEVGELG
jgi:hypothetical protein